VLLAGDFFLWLAHPSPADGLRAQKASAEASLAQAEVELKKTVIRAGVSGRVEQFALRAGDIVNPMIRAAGILIPEETGRQTLVAGFGQIEAQVMRAGMVADVTCISRPWSIIPMVVTGVQDFIAAGQFRGGEQLIDAHQVVRPGTILVFLEPLYQGGLDGVTPSSSRIANALSSTTNGSPRRASVRRSASRFMRWMPSVSFTPCCCGPRRGCFRSGRWCSADTETGSEGPAFGLPAL
jgi:multidrug resistance efflux pump